MEIICVLHLKPYHIGVNRKISRLAYLTQEQEEDLQFLKQRLNISITKIIREGVDLVLDLYFKKHKDKLK